MQPLELRHQEQPSQLEEDARVEAPSLLEKVTQPIFSLLSSLFYLFQEPPKQDLMPLNQKPIHAMLPKDVIKYLFRYLDGEDLSRVRAVCKLFKSLIDDDKTCRNRHIHHALIPKSVELVQNRHESTAQRVLNPLQRLLWGSQETTENPRERSELLLTVVKILATFDLKAAYWIAGEIEYDSKQLKALIEIAKVDPEFDIERLKKRAYGISFFHDRASFLIEIAKIDPLRCFKPDPSEKPLVERVCGRRSLPKRLSFDPAGQASCRLNKSHHPHPRSTRGFSLGSGFKEAKRVVEAIHVVGGSTDLELKATLLIPIAKEEALIELQEASNRELLPIAVAGVMARYNPDVAREEARKIPSIHLRDRALAKIDEVESNDALSKVLATNDITAYYWRAKACLAIAPILARFDVETAKASARWIEHSIRNEIYYAIAEVELRFHRSAEAAKKMVELMVDGKLKDFMLLCVVEAEAQTDLDGAKLTAQAISDPYFKTEAHTLIAKVDPDHGLKDALALNQKIEEPSLRVHSLCEIARVDPKKALEAYDLAQLLKRPWERVQALIEVSKVDPDLALNEAFEEAKKLKDSSQRDDALHLIAKEYVKTDREKAKEVLSEIRDKIVKALALLEIAQILLA